MKSKVLYLAMAWLTISTAVGRAGDYQLSWSTQNSGGGTGTGGVYLCMAGFTQMSPTRTMSRNYVAQQAGPGMPTMIQSADAPHLTITRAAKGFLRISWADSAAEFVLEGVGQLGSGNRWITVPRLTAVANGERYVLISRDEAMHYNRLRRP